MTRALVVDDSPTMQQMVRSALMRAGFEVTTASNGKEGLSGHRFTPVLVLTTEAAQQRKEQGRVAGATGWLTKPFDTEQLLAVIKKVVR
jgi:two-component system chemotaxis response regulator CheY